jgi:hypothetical protein
MKTFKDIDKDEVYCEYWKHEKKIYLIAGGPQITGFLFTPAVARKLGKYLIELADKATAVSKPAQKLTQDKGQAKRGKK